MQIDNIKLIQTENSSEPIEVSVTMTIQELVWLATVSGQQRGASPHNNIYEVLTGDLFNRYWEDGINDAQRKYQIETPPVKYDD